MELKGHFITINNKDEVIAAFSSDFKTPTVNDICVNPDGGRHFHLDLIDSESGEYKYKWDGSQIVEKNLTNKRRDKKRERTLDKLREKRIPKLQKLDEMINELVLGIRADTLDVKNYRIALLEVTEPYKQNPQFLDNLNLDTFSWPTPPPAPNVPG